MPPPELHSSVSDHASTATMLNGNVDLEFEKDLAKAEKIKEAEMGAAHEVRPDARSEPSAFEWGPRSVVLTDARLARQGVGDYPPEYAGSERSRYSAGYNTNGMVRRRRF